MALIVEDGSGMAGADSYCSLAFASARHVALGNAAWAAAASDTLREQALRRATSDMVAAYRGVWAGFRRFGDQALDWPRVSVPLRDSRVTLYLQPDIVPLAVQNACADMALLTLAGKSVLNQKRAKSRQTIGPMAMEYDQYSPQFTEFSAIEGALAPFFGGNANRIVRA